MAYMNVVPIMRNELDRDLVALVNQYLTENKDVETTNKYRRTIEDFFNTPIMHLTLDKIVRVSPVEAVDYFTKKMENGEERNTTSTRVSVIKNLYEYLISRLVKRNEVTQAWEKVIQVNPLKSYKISFEANHYGTFTDKEMVAIIEKAREMGYEKYSLYYETLAVTGLRSANVASLNIYEDFEKVDDYWRIKVGGKGKKGVKKENIAYMNDSLYQDLLAMADEKGKIFQFNKQSAYNKLLGEPGKNYENSICYAIGISEEEKNKRKLVIHSIRKLSGVEIYKRCKDIKVVQDHLNHSNSRTTDIYIADYKNDDRPIELQLNFRQTEEDRQNMTFEEKVNCMTREELIALVMKNKENIQL